MNKLKKIALFMTFSICLFSGVSVSAAGTENFSVKADEIEYDMGSGAGTAKGNVVIVHSGAKATADSAVFNNKTQSGKLVGNVVADKEDSHIECDTLVMHNQNHVSAIGNAKVKNTDKTLLAKRVDYYSDIEYLETVGKGTLSMTDGSKLVANKIKYDGKTGVAVADGSVSISSPPRKLTATADQAVYDTKKDGSVELLGNATATQNGNTVSGNRLRINNSGQYAEAVGEVKIVYTPEAQPEKADVEAA